MEYLLPWPPFWVCLWAWLVRGLSNASTTHPRGLSLLALDPVTLFSRSLAVPRSRRPQITGDSDRDKHVRITNPLEGPPTTSQGREAAESTTSSNLPSKSYRMTTAEFLSDIMIFLYAFFACAVVASRRRARRWSSLPAPRRARAPAAGIPHAHDAASFRSSAAPARTDDRRTNDATCGPQAWLTGRLHGGGIRSVRSPLRRAPLLATPIATPLQCGRPKRPGLLFL